MNIELPNNGVWSSADRSGIESIQVLRGTVWITQTGVDGDFVLHCGQSFAPAAKGRVVVWALKDTRLDIVESVKAKTNAKWAGTVHA